jgi:polysaccharide export outer membrane protein
VGLLIGSSFRTGKRLCQLALFAFCLFPMFGTMQAQTAPPSTGGSTGVYTGITNTNSNSNSQQGAGGQTSTTSGATGQAGAQEYNNGSSPRTQDQTTDRTIDRTNDRTMERPEDRTTERPEDQTLRRISPVPPPLTEFQQIVAGSTGRVVPIFGANLFNATTPSTFAPVDNIPVTPDYVIGPGDELRVQIWGQVNQRGSYVVDRTGAIALPEVGTIHVAGLQFSQLSDFLKAQLGRVYRNFDLNVNLGQLRSIQVFVVGRARQPGSFSIGSLSTLLNALFASGGPLPQGSMRDIQVKRDGVTITHFDLYDLLLHGDKTKDVRLASGDVIFIPDVGPQVAVVGSVTTAGIYELRGEKTFNQVLAMAGGETNVAAAAGMRVERIYNHTERSIMDVNLASGDSPPVQDGDILNVSSIVDRFKDAITLRGNVANPGRYSWHPGMRVSDLIPNREALVTRNYYQRQNQLGQNNTDYNGPLPEGSLGIQVTPNVTGLRGTGARGLLDGSNSTNSSSSGGGAAGAALTAAGNSDFGARTDVILSAPDIDWSYAVIERQSAIDLTTSLLPFNLGKVILDHDQSQNLELLPGDVVTIFSKSDIRVPTTQQTKFVKLEGEFEAPGPYSVLPGETLRQLLARAGGLTPNAYLFASEFTRESVRRLQRQRLLEYADTLDSEITARTTAAAATSLNAQDAAATAASAAQARATLERLRQVQPSGRIVLQLEPDSTGVGSVPDIELEDGDRFIVPKTPSSVMVVGQVYSANAFLYTSGKRTKDYLHLAGGPDRTADQKREFLLRADGSVLSRQYSSNRHNGPFDKVLMLPGDTVVVPPKVEKTSVMRNLVDIAAILQGFGIAAAAVEVLR